MCNWLLKSDAFLKRRHYLVQIAIFYALQYAVLIPSIPFLYLAQKIEGTSNEAPHHIFAALFVAPLLETLFNQYLTFRIFQKIPALQNKYAWYICTSGILFGLMHWYSLAYIIFGIAEGFVLGYTFYFYHENLSKAFWTTTLVHFLHNATSFLLAYYGVSN